MTTMPSPQVTPTNPTLFRLVRVIGLMFAYVSPFFWLTLEFGSPVEALSVMGIDLLIPGQVQLVILAALGYQAFRLVKPWHGGDRRAALHDTNFVMEGVLIFFGLLCIYGSASMIYGPWLIPFALNLFGVALIFGFRPTTAIDGVAQKIFVMGTLPKFFSFAEIDGLGTVETRMMRAGRHVGTTYHLALFPKGGGTPVKLMRMDTVAQLKVKMLELHTQTGVPIAGAR